MHVHDCTIFMEDGAPYPRSKEAIEFLKKKLISVLEWAGNTPDLSPIENLWTVTKDTVAYKQPSNVENLRQAIKKVWVTEITHRDLTDV